MRRASPGADLAWSMTSGVAAGLGATLLPVSAAVLLTGAMAAGLFGWFTHIAGMGVWMAAVMPVASAAAALFGGVAWREARRADRQSHESLDAATNLAERHRSVRGLQRENRRQRIGVIGEFPPCGPEMGAAGRSGLVVARTPAVLRLPPFAGYEAALFHSM